MVSSKKVYLPKSPVPAHRGITGYKDFNGNVVVVDRKTGEPVPKGEQPSNVKTPIARTVPAKPTKKAASKTKVITSKPDKELEDDGSGGDLAKGSDLSKL